MTMTQTTQQLIDANAGMIDQLSLWIESAERHLTEHIDYAVKMGHPLPDDITRRLLADIVAFRAGRSDRKLNPARYTE